MRSYDTVTEAINDLKARGFTNDFNVSFDKLICSENKICLDPDQFEIVEIYRFEGETNPSDEEVVYAIESKDGKDKGVLVSAYGLYADAVSDELMKKLTIHRQN